MEKRVRENEERERERERIKGTMETGKEGIEKRKGITEF